MSNSIMSSLAMVALLLCGTSLLRAEVANNPGIAISGGISGQEGMCVGSSSTYTATLEWPSGVSHPVPGKYTWSASPTGIISINGSQNTVVNSVTSDVDLVTVAGLKKGKVTLTVNWKADSGNYSMPSASKTICVIDPIPMPTPVTKVTYSEVPAELDFAEFGVCDPHANEIDITTYIDCATMVWKLKVTKADDKVGLAVTSLGRQEASAAAATAANYKDMLIDIGPTRRRATWWSVNATWAHEHAHYADWRQVNDQAFIIFQAKAEALTWPFACDTMETAAQAKARFLSLNAYQALVNELWDTADAAMPRHPAADPQTFAAERTVLDPIMTEIQIKASQNNWP